LEASPTNELQAYIQQTSHASPQKKDNFREMTELQHKVIKLETDKEVLSIQAKHMQEDLDLK